MATEQFDAVLAEVRNSVWIDPDDLDRLAAAHAAEVAERDAHYAELEAMHVQQAANIVAAIKRAEAAERDARRYRTIRNPPPKGDAMCAWSTTEDGELSERGEHDGPLTGDALDHAIDHPIVPDGDACIGGGEGK